MASVFSMQGIGNFLAPLISLCLLSTGMGLDLVWRLALGFGAIPPALTAYHRWALHKEDHKPAATKPIDSEAPPALPEAGDDRIEDEPKPKKRKLVVSWMQNRRSAEPRSYFFSAC